MDDCRIQIVATLVIVAVCTAPVHAQSQNPSIVIPNCRVSLIDRAALAGARLGILKEVVVKEGDAVQKGQTVAALRDDIPRQTLAVAEKEMSNTIDLRLSKKISELATLEYSKAVELNRTIPGGVSEIDVKKLRLAAEKSLLQLEQADFQIQMASLKKAEAEATLDTYRIVAPFSGVVLQVNKRPGEALGAGEVVVEIANSDTMRVEGFVPVTSSSRVQVGAAVVVDVQGLDPQRATRFEGRIRHIAATVNEVSQEIRVWAEVENRRHLLKDGLLATMCIRTGEMTDDATAERPVRSSTRN